MKRGGNEQVAIRGEDGKPGGRMDACCVAAPRESDTCRCRNARADALRQAVGMRCVREDECGFPLFPLFRPFPMQALWPMLDIHFGFQLHGCVNGG
jgi:hypothetical protein